MSTRNGVKNGVNGAGHASAAATSDEALDGGDRFDIGARFDGARLLLIGGTGFLGKIFWLMLLDRLPQIGKIFLLVRSSKAQSSDERFWGTIVHSEALAPLRERYGDGLLDFLREKIVPVDGDIGKHRCGIDEALLAELKGTIDAVVNVAGVVDFNPPLDEALHANAFGAQNLVELARALGNAPLYHTSTCYVAGKRRGPIAEVDPCETPFPRSAELGSELWDPDREIKECLDLIAQARHRADDAFRQSEFEERAKKSLSRRNEPVHGHAFEEELAKEKRKFVSDNLVAAGLDRATHWGWPNIYTYTKSIGEQVIARSGLPFTIARPACCESTDTFPLVGWNEGINTSAPLMYLMMKGLVQVPARHTPLDFIPTDMVTAGMILALGELLEGRAKPVYQFGASDVNPATATRFGELVGLYKRKHYQKTNKGNALLNILQSHIEPVFVTPKHFDTIGTPAFASASRAFAGLMGRAPFLRPVAKGLESMGAREEKIANILKLFEPFTADSNGPFSCANVRAAYARLTPADQARFRWAPEAIDWAEWMHQVHLPALEKYVFPEMDRKLTRELKPLRAHSTLVSLVDDMAERHDLGVALQRFEADGFSRITYRELRARANAVAARLAAARVGKGDRVILAGTNHPDWPIAYFGIVRAGAIAVPLDPGLDPEAFVNVAVQSEAKLAILDTLAREKLAGLPADALVSFDLHEITAEDASLVPPVVAVDPEDVASILFTSGTTGTPKGVKLTHANFTSLVAALGPLFPLGAKDRVLSVLPLHHTFEFTCGLLLPLSGGGRVAYLDELNGDRLMKGLKLGKVTAMVGVPALWQLLERRIVAQVKDRGPAAVAIFHWASDLNRTLGRRFGVDIGRIFFGPVHAALGGNVRYLISGGAALPHETQKLFAGLGLPLREGYGLTEAAPVLTVSKAGSAPGHVGTALPGIEVRIASPDAQGVGEVIARGPNVMAGYTDETSTEKVIDEEGWLHTGDLGKLDAKGRLSIVGRLKDVIVTTSGENVYPDDLEHRLGAIEHIAELAIVGVQTKGGERIACLAVVQADLEAPRAERNDRAMKALRVAIAKLPYREQPAVVHLYDAPLPRTATSKVKRKEVRAILERMVAASRPVGADGETSVVRLIMAAIRNKDAAHFRAESTLQDELGFDSLALSELQVALEAKYGAIESVKLQACRTVGDVEKLVDAPREARPLSPKKDLPRDADEGVAIALPPVVQEAGKRFIGKLQEAFYGQLMSARVYGRAHIPHNRNAIVIANHGSHLDMGFVRHALGKYGEDIVSMAAQDYFFDKSPLRRAFFENLTNLKAIDRKGSLRQAERAAAEILEQGKTMLIFPEGTRSHDGDIREFKPLLGHLALTYGVDILPLHLSGTREAMPKGAKIPLRRDITARIGLPLAVDEMRRLTAGMSSADACREVARLAHAAVIALRDGDMLDLKTVGKGGAGAALELPKKEHPLVTLFAELETKFKPGRIPKPVSFYFTLGGDAQAKWTVLVDADRCDIRPGKPSSGSADCVLKTSPEIFAKIVRDSYTPGPAEFLSGAIKSNDVELLLTFQKAFELG
jgi:long-chain acyl-CoA synthetase